MSWDMGSNKPFEVSASFSEDGGIRNTSIQPSHSRRSTGIESSTFGSGSSVLSSFEPPSETDTHGRQTMAYIYDAIPKSQEELEAVIANLQAIYLYRQGLKALAAERVVTQNLSSKGLSDNSLVQSKALPSVPTAIPGSAASIWRMDADPLSTLNNTIQPAVSTDMVDTNDFALKSQYQMCQDVLARNKMNERKNSSNGGGVINASGNANTNANAHLSDNGHTRRHRRKNHRQNSAPVALCAPQWADASSWNPRMNLKSNSQNTGHGTGVFLPPHLANSSVLSGEENEDQHSHTLQY